MPSTYVEKLEDTQRDLTTYFDKSATVVRRNFNWFEKEYGRPAVTYTLASFEAYPLTSTFIAISSLLSILPLISFLVFSLIFSASIVFVASALSIMAIAAVEAFFATILLTTLSGLLCLSVFLTPLAISTHLAFRLIIHVQSDGRPGVSQWATETKRHFIRSNQVKVGELAEGSEISTGSGSVVMVDGKEDHRSSEHIKVEGE